MNIKRITVLLLGLMLVFSVNLTGINSVQASDYPSGDVRVIIPWAAGGFTDMMVRPMVDWLENYFGNNFVVDNVAGGVGVIGSRTIENATPDGYTIGTTSLSTITARLTSPVPPDMNNVETIAHIFSIPAALTVKADSQWETLEDFLDYARENPGFITVSNSGVGASVHIYAVAFEQVADIQLVHVPYSGGGPATTALVGGHVNATFNSLPDVADQANAGALRILAIATEERNENFPDVPTFKELGYDYVIGNYTGFVAPRGMAQEQIAILEAAIEEMVADPDMRKFMIDNGYAPEFHNSERFREILQDTEESVDFMVEELGIQL